MTKVRRFYTSIPLFLVLFNCITSVAQTNYSNEVFNIIFKHDFENNTPGNYLDSEFNADWNNPAWSNRTIPPEIVSDPATSLSGSKYMRWHFPAGGVGPEESGGQWLTYMAGGHDELYLSYNLRFKPGFEWVLSGKLPGLRGGEPWPGTGPPPWDAGFVALLAWTRDGKIMCYYYHHDQTHEYGDAVTWNYTFEPGKWYNITLRVVMNTLNENGGNNDGILEGFVNGTMVAQRTGLKLRNISAIHVDRIFMSSSYGGYGDEYAPSSNQYLDVDDFVAFKYQDNVNVTRGNSVSPASTQLNIPFTSVFNTAWQSSIQAVAQSSKQVKISWQDYSTPGKYTLERRLANETSYTVISQLNYGTSSYTDQSVNPLTGYYYRVGCNGLYTNEAYAVTPAANIPAIPGTLSGGIIGYKEIALGWADNSNNETGFEIWRKTASESDFSRINTTTANLSSWNDLTVIPGVQYSYRIRAVNSDGASAFTNTLQLAIPMLAPPAAPSALQSAAVTEKSISVSWNDNSANEKGFVVTRSLAADPSLSERFEVKANDTSYTDEDLMAGTTYVYTVNAINEAGNSPSSNKNVISTLSVAETKRIRDGLIAYYNFGYNTDQVIYDQSGYGNPLNLKILNSSAISWDETHKMELLSNTALMSITPATKIVEAVKRTNAITVECWLKPDDYDITSKSRIFSLAKDENDVGVVLDQNMTYDTENKNFGYSVRMQTSTTNSSGYPEIESDKSFTSLTLLHLTYVRDSLGRETVFLNGDESSSGYRPSDLNTWNANYYLKLGNGADMNFPWKGSFYAVAIYDKALSQSEIQKNFSAGPCDSLNNEGVDYDLSIYPNPATDLANIEITPVMEADMAPHTTFRIMDISGQIYHQERIFNPNQQISRTFDFRSFSKGIYFVQIISGKHSKSAKLVIQ